jgi:DNA-binding transcriptional ArsR family regulator
MMSDHLADDPTDAALCQDRRVHPDAVARVRLAVDETYRRVAELFGSLANPTRAKIVHALQHHELCTCDLAAVVGVTESGVSQHLRILRTLHVVKSRRAGKFVYYSLDDAHVALLMQLGLTHQGHADTQLDALKPVSSSAGQVPGSER